jgi:hypothetical protein
MMFGLWYLVLTFTSMVHTTEVCKSTEAERVLALLNRVVAEVQNTRKAYGEANSPEYNIEAIKKRIIEII